MAWWRSFPTVCVCIGGRRGYASYRWFAAGAFHSPLSWGVPGCGAAPPAHVGICRSLRRAPIAAVCSQTISHGNTMFSFLPPFGPASSSLWGQTVTRPRPHIAACRSRAVPLPRGVFNGHTGTLVGPGQWCMEQATEAETTPSHATGRLGALHLL